MGFISLSDLVETHWRKVTQFVKSSLLVLDDAAAEILHWHGGLKLMLDAGAKEIKRLSPYEKINSDLRKAVFIVTSPLKDDVLQILMTTVRGNNFKHCIIVTSLSPKCHAGDNVNPDHIFPTLEKYLREWMGNMNYIAQVEYIPLTVACLTAENFLIPAFSKGFSLLNLTSLILCQEKKPTENLLKEISPELQSTIKSFAGCLGALLDGLQVKGDVFSVGQVSHVIASELENVYHAAKRKPYSNKASVLLIDRSLDLAGPLSQATETLFGRMLRLLPHLPGHTTDVSISMSELASCSDDTVFEYPLLAPGCLAHKSTPTEIGILNSVFYNRLKEATMDIIRKIVQVTSEEHLCSDNSIVTTSKSLKKKILLFKEKPKLLMKYCGLLQQALAAIQVLEHPLNSYCDSLLATEKLLMQNLSLDKYTIASDIINLINKRSERGYKLIDILMLIAFLYTLAGSEVLNDKDETAVQATIIEALFQHYDECQEIVKSLVEDNENDQSILYAVKSFFNVLKNLGDIRSNFKKYRYVFQQENPALPATYISILKQILNDVFNSPEVVDINYHSAGLTNYIKSGFSLFMNVGKSHPKDNNLIIVIILGGVTPTEMREIHELIIRQKSNIQVLVGSTNILSPSDVIDDLFSVAKNLSYNEVEEEDDDEF